MVAGNVFVNNYQKYFLINAFLSIRLDSTRYDAKRSLLLNFFLIDFSRANLGMHWHQASPEAPMHMSIVRREDRLPCGSCSFVSSPLFRNCLSTEIYVHFPLFSFQFFSSLFFVISFENVRLVIQQIPSLSFLQCLLFPFLLLLDTYIHASHLSCSMSFHSPLGTFPLPPCLIICFLNAIFYVAPFWFVSPCRVVFTCRISLVRVCFLLHVIPVFSFFFLGFCLCFFSIRCSVIYVQQFQGYSRCCWITCVDGDEYFRPKIMNIHLEIQM